MTADEIKQLGFWMHIHSQAYDNGVELAKELLTSVNAQRISDDKKTATDRDVNIILDRLDSNNLDTTLIQDFFERRPDYFDNSDKKIGLPPKELYDS